MNETTKLLVWGFAGIVLFSAYFVAKANYNDITKTELHEIFLLSCIGFFTILNFVRYSLKKRKEKVAEEGDLS